MSLLVTEVLVEGFGDPERVAAGGFDDRLPGVEPLLGVAVTDHAERGERGRRRDRQPNRDVASLGEMCQRSHVISVRFPARRGELEPGELKSWHDDATHEREFTGRLGGLPGAGRNKDLRVVGAQHMIGAGDREPQRGAAVIQPDLVGVDTMPMRALTGTKQEVDGGTGGAPVATIRPTPRLDEVPTLRMRLEIQLADERISVHEECSRANANVGV